MLYIKKFNTDTDKEKYIKNNFISPHLFLNSENKNINYLPKYKRLSYISSTPTGGQYIDLGCHLLENTDDIKINIKFNIRGVGKSSSGSDTSLATLIGSQPEVSPWPGFILRRGSANSNYIMLQTKWEFSNSTKASNSDKWFSNYLSCLKYGSTWGNIHSWCNIYEFSETLDNIPSSQVNNCTCTLFCALDGSNNPFRYVEADLYYLRLLKGNNVVRNLIPVQRMFDNEVGLWDLENQVFYTSQGDYSFVAGIE